MRNDLLPVEAPSFSKFYTRKPSRLIAILVPGVFSCDPEWNFIVCRAVNTVLPEYSRFERLRIGCGE
jgi:hypothetical protein